MAVKIIKNWRYWVLMAVFTVAVFGILSVPNDNSRYYFSALIASKVIGIAAVYVGTKLVEYWHEAKKINELTNYINNNL